MTFHKLSLIVLLALMALQGFAQENSSDENITNETVNTSSEAISGDLPEKVNHLNVGLLSSFFNYQEPGVMEMNGQMLGVQGRWSNLDEVQGNNNIFLQAEGSYQRGNLKYDGGLFWTDEYGNYHEKPYSNDDNKVSVMKMAGFVGKSFDVNGLGAGSLIIPQIGVFAYQLIDADDPDPYDYKRVQNYYTIPLRVEIINLLRSDLLRAHMTYHSSVFFMGRNTSYFHGEEVKFKQNKGSAMEIGADWTTNNFNFGLIYEKWQVSKSSVDRNLIEPRNETSFLTLTLGYVF